MSVRNKKKFYLFVGLAMVTIPLYQSCGQFAAISSSSVSIASIASLNSSCIGQAAPGHSMIHRLTPAEYDNTVRDLLQDTLQPGTAFPPDTPNFNGSGYSNESQNQVIDDNHVSLYYAAAQSIAQEVIGTKGKSGGAYASIVTCTTTQSGCPQTVIQNLATRAYRRPVSATELSSLMAIYSANADFDTGLTDVITALLINPKFLFVSITDAQSTLDGATFAIDDYALASRLSYYLWGSMPDATLMALAQSGTLHQASVVASQAARMLKDAKSKSFLLMLRNEWANLANLANPAATLQGLDDSTRAAMVAEVDAFLQDIVTNDKSFLNVINGNYAVVNQTMANYYGMPFTGSNASSFVQVANASTYNRMGIAGTAAVQTVNAGDITFTHPVIRGKWFVHKVTCVPVSSPPPGIPTLNPDPAASGGTVKQRLSAHANLTSTCVACHITSGMDDMGLALENYDAFGKWRTSYADASGSASVIDPSGHLTDGTAFNTATDMLTDLGGQQAVRTCLTTQIMNIALQRSTANVNDQCTASSISQSSVTPTGKFSSLVSQVVTSNQFLMQTGEGQ